MNKDQAAELEADLCQFTGTEAYHKFSPFSKLVLTDGVKYLCEKAGAYWLMDAIASYQKRCNADEMLRAFQIWTLTVEDSSGTLKCERDTNDVAITQNIPYTDFPMPSVKLYCIDGVILLPSEY
jgi:hypothetical protein